MARWNHHQAPRSIYNRGQGDEAAPPMPPSPRPDPRGGRASGPRPKPPSRPSSRGAAESGLPGVMGRAGEPCLRGRHWGPLRDPGRHHLGAGRPPALRVLTPRACGLWTFPRPFAGRQLDLDGASPTFVRQVRHFTSSSPPTRLRAGRRSPAFCQKLSRVRTSQADSGRGGQLAPARRAWRGVELRVAVTARPGSEHSPGP